MVKIPMIIKKYLIIMGIFDCVYKQIKITISFALPSVKINHKYFFYALDRGFFVVKKSEVVWSISNFKAGKSSVLP